MASFYQRRKTAIILSASRQLSIAGFRWISIPMCSPTMAAVSSLSGWRGILWSAFGRKDS